jgi:DNA replication protein DnaC
MKKETERHVEAYEKAVHRARVPIPMRKLSLVARSGREPLTADRKNRRLADACQNWNGIDWLVATGSVGSGKTSWLTALLMEALWKNPKLEARWTSEQRLYRKAMLHGDKSSAGRERVLQEFMDAEILVLDDLGASRRALTEWQGGAMRDLLIERHLTGVPTFISTNLDLDEIASRYGDHVSSRLSEVSGGIIQIGGRDRRGMRPRSGRR